MKKLGKEKSIPFVAGLTALCTVVSGTIFLNTALILSGLPGDSTFLGLFIGVVIPTAVLSTIAMAVIYPIVTQIMKRSRIALEI